MKKTAFNAFCPVQIGDQSRDTSGRIHTISDIACVHYVRAGKVEFRFELDHSGKYVTLDFVQSTQTKPTPKDEIDQFQTVQLPPEVLKMLFHK